MANVHRLQDLESQNAGDGGVWGNRQRGYMSAPAMHPSEMKCIDMFLPGFSVTSFILWVSVVQVAVYLITLQEMKGPLEPSGRILYAFGSAYGPSIVAGEVWRFITPMFLHASIWHIFFNVFFQMRMGLELESRYGIAKTAFLYFISGIAGVLFTVSLNFCGSEVGASVAGFGLIGCLMSELALRWHMTLERDRTIYSLISWLFIVVIMSFAPGSNIDWRGHLGGFIAGFAIGVMFNRQMEDPPRWLKTGFIVACSVLVAEYIGCTLGIFLAPHKC